MKTKIRIVEVEGGMFAVQKRVSLCWLFTCNSGDGYIWRTKLSIFEHSLMESEKAAEICFNKLKKRLEMEKRKVPKVVRVIKTATV